MPQRTITAEASLDTPENVSIGGANDPPLVSGEDATIYFLVSDGVGGLADLSASAVALTFQVASDFSKTLSGGGITKVSGANGLISVTLEPSDTSGFGDVTKSIELRRTDTDNVQSLALGNLDVTGGEV